jgi:Transposase IS4
MLLLRFEIYVGKRELQDSDTTAFDHKTGPAAVIRNLKVVLEGASPGFSLVIIDRFYSSVPLAIQLLSMFVYVVGTIQTNRIGFDRRVVERRTTRPLSIERGRFTFSRSVVVPTMVACHWWDKKPVHYLATGVVMTEDSIHRNIKGMGSQMITCPKIITEYQDHMGGVDVHDQLRLQSYSVQMAFRFRKYYKSLFLGLMDLALVNAYLTHKEACRLNNSPAMTRVEWYGVLHQQILRVKELDFEVAGDIITPSRTRQRRRTTGHELMQGNDWITTGEQQKRRQRSCKVCGLLRGSAKKSFQTTWYCERCSVDAAKCFLCPKARREYNGVSKTCFQIWHEDFEGGLNIPASLGKRVVMRRPAASKGARVPTRREINMTDDDDEDDDGEDEEQEQASPAQRTTKRRRAPTSQASPAPIEASASPSQASPAPIQASAAPSQASGTKRRTASTPQAAPQRTTKRRAASTTQASPAPRQASGTKRRTAPTTQRTTKRRTRGSVVDDEEEETKSATQRTTKRRTRGSVVDDEEEETKSATD